MIYALTAALILQIVMSAWLLDRKDKRHDQHVRALVHWRQDPKTAALADMPTAELLYLPPEDDKAWNEHHGTGD